MAMTARVTNLASRIVAEKRGGIRHYHSHDPLGHTVGLYDDGGDRTDTYTYWPYGEIRLGTGATTNPFKYGGGWGYYTDASTRIYVRARVLRQDLGRWLTIDPVWPVEPGYQYAYFSPIVFVDPEGLCPIADPCTGWSPKKKCDELHKLYKKDPLTKDAEGGNGCCDGVAFICSWPHNIPPAYLKDFEECTLRHEKIHGDDKRCPCDPTGFDRKLCPDTTIANSGECTAYKVSLSCYREKKKKCKDEACRKFWHNEIWWACEQMKRFCPKGDKEVGKLCKGVKEI